MLRWKKTKGTKSKNGKKGGRSYSGDTGVSDSHASESESHASQPDSSNPVLSELDRQTNDITTQLASTFRITDDQDDTLFSFTVNEDPTEHMGGSDVMSLDTSPSNSFPADSLAFQSPSPAPETPHETPSPSHRSDSLDVNDTVKTGRALAGILKKHKGKSSKKVKFAITPSKIMKHYRSAEERNHKPDRSLNHWTHVIREYQCTSSGSGKGKGKGRDKAGNKDDESFPIASKSSFNDLIEYIRQSTACKANTRDPIQPQLRQRESDIRVWDYRNIWCTKCYGECPICDTCCVYEELRRAISDEESDPLVSRDRGRTMGLIEVVGAYVKDASTFSLCSAPGGCGRHVCPSCCGMCPDDWCQDMQCKECKADPWANCDWHERSTVRRVVKR